MAVSNKDRRDYERGLRDRRLSVWDQFWTGITCSNPTSPAYRRGRRGEQLDGDKRRRR